MFVLLNLLCVVFSFPTSITHHSSSMVLCHPEVSLPLALFFALTREDNMRASERHCNGEEYFTIDILAWVVECTIKLYAHGTSREPVVRIQVNLILPLEKLLILLHHIVQGNMGNLWHLRWLNVVELNQWRFSNFWLIVWHNIDWSITPLNVSIALLKQLLFTHANIFCPKTISLRL